MSSSAELQLLYKVANAPLNWFPYPHFFVEDVFPAEFYEALQANVPDPAVMRPLDDVRGVKRYDERFVLDFRTNQLAALSAHERAFWSDLHGTLLNGKLRQIAMMKFGQFIDQRFRKPNLQVTDEALLIQDITNYALGPHTDTPSKVLSFLFYLPRDTSQAHLGTSMYLPKNAGFNCPGGPHYEYDRFDRVMTMPFLPNSLFAFFKNDLSFHGVERVADENCRRWLLLYDIYLDDASRAPQSAELGSGGALKFSF